MINLGSLKNFIAKPMKTYLNDGVYRRNGRYAYFYEHSFIKNKSILYECRDGKSMTDNTYAIFKYLMENEEFKDYKHIWVVDSAKKKTEGEKYYNNNRVKFAIKHSKEYLKNLASCKYLINNSTFPSYFECKKNQVYINTWHGTPLKHMGRDMIEEPLNTKNITRNFMHTDYMILPNHYTTEIFKSAYYLDGIYRGKIIEEGYPRIDLTINTDRNEFKNKLIKMDLDIKLEKEMILYAPTWKGKNISSPNNDIDRILNDINEIKQKIDNNKYDVIIKVHPFLYSYVEKRGDMKHVCIPDEIDTNELLSCVDILITDYSSLYFDYLVTERPILFYMLDKEEYNGNRGLYIDQQEMPGPVICKIEEVIDKINEIDKVKIEYKEKYLKAKNKFCGNDDGKVTERIADIIFKGNTNHNIIKVNNDKEHILIYTGGMKNNGITASLINLLNNINYDKYNVSVFINDTKDFSIINNIIKINPKCNKFFKIGRLNFRLQESYREKYIVNRSKRGKLAKLIYPKKLFKREFIRNFGKLEFDYIIDFSGYSMFWQNIILQGNAKKKILYMHNDLLLDSQKEIDGKKMHERNLNGVFSLLPEFDELASVSPACRDINKKNLGHITESEKFKYVLNSINAEKILRNGNKSSVKIDGAKKYLISNKYIPQEGTLEMDLINIPDDELINIVSLGNLDDVNIHIPIIKKILSLNNKKVRLYLAGNEEISDNIKYYVEKYNNISIIENNLIWLNMCDYIIYNHTCISDYRYTLQLNILNKNMNKMCLVRDSRENRTLLGNLEFIVDENELNNKIDSIINEYSESKYIKEKIHSPIYEECIELEKNGEICLIDNIKYFFVDSIDLDYSKHVSAKILPDKNKINFINIGRLSPEKDQEKLILAFKQVHEKFPDTCLYLVGDGLLKEKLEDLINQLNLNNSVYLMGQLETPFYLLKQCSCFVLSSNYEGQPMVLLEAMTLGKKIIATDIEQNKYVLQDGHGDIVENSVIGLANGMEKFIKEDMDINKFDYNKYNEMAMDTFYRILNN